jgi:hypothetical protein
VSKEVNSVDRSAESYNMYGKDARNGNEMFILIIDAPEFVSNYCIGGLAETLRGDVEIKS